MNQSVKCQKQKWPIKAGMSTKCRYATQSFCPVLDSWWGTDLTLQWVWSGTDELLYLPLQSGLRDYTHAHKHTHLHYGWYLIEWDKYCRDAFNFHPKKPVKAVPSTAGPNKYPSPGLQNENVSCFHWSDSNKPKQNNQSVASSEQIKSSFVLSPSLHSTGGCVHTGTQK